MNNKPAVAVLIVCVLIGVAAAAIVEDWIFHETGQVIEAYLSPFDETSAPYVNGTSIDWGTVEPGSSYYVTLTVRNVSPVSLEVYIGNQGIDLYPYLTCTWDGDHTVLAPDEEVSGALTLTVDISAIQGEVFSFDTKLYADDQT